MEIAVVSQWLSLSCPSDNHCDVQDICIAICPQIAMQTNTCLAYVFVNQIYPSRRSELLISNCDYYYVVRKSKQHL